MARHPRIEFYDRKRRSSTITGRDPLPRHLAIAFGRYIFRLSHTPAKDDDGIHRPSIYLRDLSLGVVNHLVAYRAYAREMARAGLPMDVKRNRRTYSILSPVPCSLQVIHL